MTWNNLTKRWNWMLIVLFTGVIAAVIFIAYFYIESYRLNAFQNHVYCEVLQKGMLPNEVDAALDRIGKHAQVDVTDQVILNIEPIATYYRLVLFDDANVHIRIGVGYDLNENLIWVTRGEILPKQVVQCQ